MSAESDLNKIDSVPMRRLLSGLRSLKGKQRLISWKQSVEKGVALVGVQLGVSITKGVDRHLVERVPG